MRYCVHGQPLDQNLVSHPHREELEDPNDFGIMEFYQTCDCCGCLIHNDAPRPGNDILQPDGSVFCQICDKGSQKSAPS